MLNVKIKNGWKVIGRVGVDSGQVMIVDPCYLKDWKADDFSGEESKVAPEDSVPFSYEGACQRTLSDAGAGSVGHGSLAVASGSGHGDGCYPVLARFGGGRVLELRVLFDDRDIEPKIAAALAAAGIEVDD